MDFKDLPQLDISEAKKIVAARATALQKEHKGVRQVLFFGHRGVGKSQIIAQVAEELNIGFKSVNLSALEAPDFQGLPHIEHGRTIYARPSVLPEGESGIFFLDEINRASLDIRQALLQLLTEHQVNGHKLGKKWLIVAAGNLSDDSTQYSVDDLDPALHDRFAVYRLNPHFDTVLAYLQSKHGADHLGLRWLKSDQNVISMTGKGPSPRSFDAMCAALTATPEVDNFLTVSGELGRSAAAAFLGWYKSPQSLAFKDIWECTPHAGEILHELQTNQGGRIELLKVALDGYADTLAPNENFRKLTEDELTRVVWFMERLTAPEWQTAFLLDSNRFLGYDLEGSLKYNHEKIVTMSPKTREWANKVSRQIAENKEGTDTKAEEKDAKKKKGK